MNEIVIGVDGSGGADRALDWAIGEARLRAAPMRAVFAYNVARVPAGEQPPSAHRLREEAQETVDRAVEAALVRAEDDGSVKIVTEVVPVNDRGPAPILIAASKHAALLVLGSRGLGGFMGLLMGSVSEQCVTHAVCPVVVVPGRRPPLPD